MLSVGIKVASFLAFVAASVWLYSEPKAETWVACGSTLVVFLGSFLPDLARKLASSSQQQAVAENAFGIQAGGDVRIEGSEVGSKSK